MPTLRRYLVLLCCSLIKIAIFVRILMTLLLRWHDVCQKTFIIAHHRNYSSDGKTVYPFYISVPTAIFPSIVFFRMRIHRPFADLSGNTKQSEESVKRLRG